MTKPLYGTLAEAIEQKDTCPNCNGRGVVVIRNVRKRSHSNDEPIDAHITCVMCLGSGNILGNIKAEE